MEKSSGGRLGMITPAIFTIIRDDNACYIYSRLLGMIMAAIFMIIRDDNDCYIHDY